MQLLQDRMIFDASDWLAGIAPQGGGTSSNALAKIGNGFSYSVAVDPIRALGHLYPGKYPTDATNVSEINAYQNNFAVAAGSTSYVYSCGGTKVHRINLSTDTVSNSGGWPYTITGSTMGDCIVYNANGTNYLFVSYHDGTDMEIARYDLSSTWIDNYWSSTLSQNSTDQNVPHPMIIGADGVLYIGDGRFVAAIDGTSSPVGNANILDLPHGFVINSFAKTDRFLVIYAYYTSGNYSTSYFRGHARAFFWDYSSTSWTYEYDLNDNYVDGGFTWRNTVGCFTQGRGKGGNSRESALRVFDGTKFTIPGNAVFQSNIPRHGGVEIMDDMIYWNSSGWIYSYGSVHGLQDAMQCVTKLNYGVATTYSGGLKNTKSGTLYASTATGTSGGLQVFSANYVSNSDARTVEHELPFPVQITGYRTYFTETISSAAAAANTYLYYDGGYSVNIQNNIDTVTGFGTAESATSKHKATEAKLDANGGQLPAVSSIGVGVSWGVTGDGPYTSAVGISRIEVLFKPYAI